MKIKHTKYNCFFKSTVWMFLAFLLLGQSPPIDATDIEEKIAKWNFQNVTQVSQLIDQITYFKNQNIAFKNRYGGLIAPDNQQLAINQKIIADIVYHLEKIRKGENKERVLKALESDFDQLKELLLPPKYWSQIQEIEASVTSIQNKEKEIEAYALSALALINSTLPHIETLILSESPITVQRITDVYFKVKSTQATLELLASFIENNDREFVSTLLGEADIDFLLDFSKKFNFQAYVNNNIKKMVTDAEAIKEYQHIKKECYLTRYKDLENKINFLYTQLKSIHGEIQKQLNGFVELANTKVGDYIQESKILSNRSIIESGEYINIYPPRTNAATAKYWIRANLPVGTLRSLELNGKEVKDVPISFSMVYKINHGNNAKIIDKQDFLGGKLIQNDIKIESLKNLTAEIPLGLSVEQVRLTKAPSEFLNTKIYAPSFQNEAMLLSFNKIGIHLPEDGPWTNYKQQYEQQSELLHKIGVNKALGLEVIRIRISQDSLMPTLTIKINSGGFLSSIIGSSNEFSTFEINLGDLDNGETEILKLIQAEVNKQAEQRLNAALEANRESIKEMLVANSIDFVKAKINNGILTGKIKFTPKSFKIGNQVFPVGSCELQFQSKFSQGKLSLELSNPTLQYEAYVKKFLEDKLHELQGLEELIPQINKNTVFFNIIQNIRFDSFNINTEKKQISTQIWIDSFDQQRLLIVINKNGIRSINGFDELIKGYVTNQIEALVKPQFEEACHSFFKGTDRITVFGETFRLSKTPNCSNLNLTFKGTHVNFPDNYIEVLLQSNGKVTLISFNAPKVLEKLDDAIKNYLALDLEYVKFLNPRFQNGKLVFDCHVDIPILNINETIGVLTLSHQNNDSPQISFAGATAQELIKQKINAKFIAKLNEYISTEKLQLEFTDEGDGVKITALDEGSTDLFQKNIGLKAKITLVDLFEINPININLNIETGSIGIEPINLKNSALANLKKQIKGEIVPGLSAQVTIAPMASPIRLEGDIQINLHGMQFPSMGFVITHNNIVFHPNLSFPIPGHFQIVDPISSPPGLVLTNGMATLDLEKKQLKFSAAMTVGEANTARENARLINMQSSIASYYEGSRLGDFELQANVILVSVLNVMEGKGTIKTKEGCFKLKTSTTGPLRDVFKFDQRVTMNCDNMLFQNFMDVDVIGLKNRLNIYAKKSRDKTKIDLSGTTRYSLLGANLQGGIETSLEMDNPLSFAKNASANFGGSMKVNKFKLSGVDLGVNYYNASLDFTVMGMELGIATPNVGSITEGKILDQILSMLDVDPKAVLDLLKNPTKIKFKIAPMGIGESAKSNAKGGKNDNGSSSRNQANSETNTGTSIAGATDISGIVPNELSEAEKKAIEKQISNTNQAGIPGFFPVRVIVDINRDSQGKPKSNLSYKPKNLKGALEINYGWGKTYHYVGKSVSERFNNQYKFGGYSGNLTTVKNNGESVCYILKNEEYCFPSFWFAYPYFNWGYALNNQDNEFYLYLKWSPWGIFHYRGWNIPNISKRMLVNDLNLVEDKQLFVFGEITKLENFNGSFTSDVIVNHEISFTSDIVFYRQKDEFLNLNGKSISQTKGTGLKGIFNRSKYKAFYQYIVDSDFEQLVVSDGVGYAFTKNTPIYYKKEYTDEDIKDIYHQNIATLDSVWFKLDRNVLSGLGITDNMLLHNGGTTQLDNEARLKLNVIINRIIKDPDSKPLYENIKHKNKPYQIWNTSKTKVNEFINKYGNTITIDNAGLFTDLKIYETFENLRSKISSNGLAKTTLANLSDHVIHDDYKYVSKNQDSLIFMSADWSFAIQKKDTLVHLKDRIKSNSFPINDDLKDGDRLNKSKFLDTLNGVHTKFITKLVSMISADTTTTAKIENEQGRFVGYFLGKKTFNVIWETQKGAIESLSLERSHIEAKILASQTNAFSRRKLITSIDQDFTLENLITYFKKGFTRTTFWYDNPDKIQSLIILL